MLLRRAGFLIQETTVSDLPHLVQLIYDHTPHELEGHREQEGGHPLHRQTPGADRVQQAVLNIKIKILTYRVSQKKL